MLEKSIDQTIPGKKPVKQVALILLSSALIMEIVFGILCFGKGYQQFFCIFVTALMIMYHVLIRFSTPRILQLLHKKEYNSDNWWFKQKFFEKPVYKLCRVKRWKEKLITYDPETFLLSYTSPEGVVQSMCHAEVIHVLLGFESLLSILFGLIFGRTWIFVLTGCFAAVWELRFVMAQRYNRPRVKEIIRHRSMNTK